jgi:hypothetical protein
VTFSHSISHFFVICTVFFSFSFSDRFSSISFHFLSLFVVSLSISLNNMSEFALSCITLTSHSSKSFSKKYLLFLSISLSAFLCSIFFLVSLMSSFALSCILWITSKILAIVVFASFTLSGSLVSATPSGVSGVFVVASSTTTHGAFGVVSISVCSVGVSVCCVFDSGASVVIVSVFHSIGESEAISGAFTVSFGASFSPVFSENILSANDDAAWNRVSTIFWLFHSAFIFLISSSNISLNDLSAFSCVHCLRVIAPFWFSSSDIFSSVFFSSLALSSTSFRVFGSHFFSSVLPLFLITSFTFHPSLTSSHSAVCAMYAFRAFIIAVSSRYLSISALPLFIILFFNLPSNIIQIHSIACLYFSLDSGLRQSVNHIIFAIPSATNQSHSIVFENSQSN